MKAIARAFPAFLLSLAFTAFSFGTLSAQESEGKTPSKEELEKYVEVDLALRDIRRERRKKIMKLIRNSELGMKEYRQVDTKQNDGSAEVPEEKQQAYEEIKKKVKAVQKKYRKKERSKMKEMGMAPERYREISQMKTKEKVRKRLVRIKEKKMEKAQEGSGN